MFAQMSHTECCIWSEPELHTKHRHTNSVPTAASAINTGNIYIVLKVELFLTKIVDSVVNMVGFMASVVSMNRF